MGKVFHPGIACNHSDDMPYSWTEPPYHPPTQEYKNAPVCSDLQDNSSSLHSNIFCPVDVQSQPGGSLPDLQTLDTALKFLQEVNSSSKPFFLAVGLHKPHVPHKFPKEYLQYHPYESIKLPSNHYR